MEMCSFDPQLQMLFNRYVLISIILVGLSFSLKNKKSLFLSFFTALSFWVGYNLQCDFKVNDPEHIWRYVFWVGLDSIYMLVLFAIYRLKRITEWQFAAICTLQAFSFLIQLIRLPDAHRFNYVYTDSFYPLLMNAYNIAIITTVTIPLAFNLIEKIKEYKKWKV